MGRPIWPPCCCSPTICVPPRKSCPRWSSLPHHVKVAQAEATALLDAPARTILLDARRDLVGARSLCRLIETTGKEAPLLVIAHEGGLAALSADWGFDDLLLATAGPAEVDVRLRLAMTPSVATNVDPVIQSGNIMIDEGYSKLNGVQLDLTYTEFELLKYLAQHRDVFGRRRCRATFGDTTTTAAPEPSTSMCGDCAPSSARSTSRSSARFATDTDSSRPAESAASPARA